MHRRIPNQQAVSVLWSRADKAPCCSLFATTSWRDLEPFRWHHIHCLQTPGAANDAISSSYDLLQSYFQSNPDVPQCLYWKEVIGYSWRQVQLPCWLWTVLGKQKYIRSQSGCPVRQSRNLWQGCRLHSWISERVLEIVRAMWREYQSLMLQLSSPVYWFVRCTKSRKPGRDRDQMSTMQKERGCE